MEWKEIMNASPTELQRRLGELRERLRDLRFRVAAGQEKDVREIRQVRRTIAQILTRLRQPVTTKEKSA